MKIFLYNCFVLILLPAMAFRIVFKSLKDHDYKKHFFHRLGIYKDIKSLHRPIWFHAVSLGEVISSKSIVNDLLKNNEVIMTVSTPTGLREAKKIYGDNLTVVYTPWDLIIFVKKFIKKFNPVALIIFETEIWPSMIYQSSKNNIPIILSNARLSQTSYRSYMRFKFFVLDTLNKFSLILAQSDQHLDRFRRMGVSINKIKKVGSVKFDIKIKRNESIKRFDNLVLAASTHIGEDEIIADTFIRLKKEFDNLKLIIVPRHPERSIKVHKIFKDKLINSEISSILPGEVFSKDVVIINSIGMLNDLYKMATISFIGGSLFKQYGGHNIVEPAINKCSFIVGPFMKNFEEVINIFKIEDACIQISDSELLYSKMKELLTNHDLRNNMTNNALKVIENNRGSSEIQFKYINNLINYEISNSNN